MALIPIGLKSVPLPTIFDFTDEKDKQALFKEKWISKYEIRKVNIYKLVTIARIPIYPVRYVSSERELKDEKGEKYYRTRKISTLWKVLNRLFLVVLYSLLRGFYCIMQYFYKKQ